MSFDALYASHAGLGQELRFLSSVFTFLSTKSKCLQSPGFTEQVMGIIDKVKRTTKNATETNRTEKIMIDKNSTEKIESSLIPSENHALIRTEKKENETNLDSQKITHVSENGEKKEKMKLIRIDLLQLSCKISNWEWWKIGLVYVDPNVE